MHRRPGRRFRLASLLMAMFLALHLLGPLPRFLPRAEAADPAPLPMPEDPLAANPEGQHPEISVQVDPRDGHLTVRVVDNWGPGGTPFLVRTYNNTTPATETSAVGAWHLNQILEIRHPQGNLLQLREADGTLSTYNKTGTRTDGTGTYWIYTKTIGAYATIETAIAEHVHGGDSEFHWSGIYTQFLSKGASRKFVGPSTIDIPPDWAGITEERDANGNVRTSSWGVPAAGAIRTYLLTRTDEIGRVTTYGYEQAGCEPQDPGGSGLRQPASQRAPAPQLLPCLWHYRVKTITDAYGRVVTFTYDVGGFGLIRVQNAAGATTTYNSGAPLTGVQNARGFGYTFTWTTTGTLNRISRVTAPDGTATTYTYTAVPPAYGVNDTTITNARGFAIVQRYNATGDMLSVTDALGGVTAYTYDGLHNVTQVTNARGFRTTYAYNSRNMVTQVVQDAGGLALTTTLSWDGSDNLLTVTNPRGIITAYAYNATHNLTSVTRAQGTPAQAVTAYTYTTWGGVASVTDPRGKITTFTYDTRRRLTTVDPPAGGNTTYAYNTLDDRISMTNGNGRTWTYTYDAARNLLTETDPRANRTSYLYDVVGNRTRVTDPKGFFATFVYDARDRITTITDPLNQSTSYLYDAVGNLMRITNARGHATNFAYDALNRLSSVTDALGRATTYQYDAVGNRTRMTDRKGQVFIYTYDAVDRLTQVQVGTTTFSYTYDQTGNRLTLTDGTGATSFQYDQLDRLTRMTYPDTKAVIYAYDAAGNRTSLTNPGNVAFTYRYDNANRLDRITQGSRIWTFGYDAAGNRASLAHANGARIDYTYLTNNWLGTITHKRGDATTFETLTYAYDGNGNRTTLTDATGSTTFGYDSLNRLTSAAYPGTYGTWSWTYDQVGNRLTQNSPSGQTNYGYDANNRLTSSGSSTYSYDNNGNLTSISTGNSFTYDAHNRMSQATLPGGLVVQYTYNGDGLKIRRIEGATTTRYYHDGIRPLYEAKADGSRNADLERDIFGNLLARQDAGGTRYYYHHDGLGSTVGLTDASGAVAAQRTYDAWGNRRTSSGSAPPGSYQFTGAELDATSGLYHMGARFYDPTIGRWLSEDPVQDKHFDPETLNFYAYVLNNPLALVDPDGEAPIPPQLLEKVIKILEKVQSNPRIQEVMRQGTIQAHRLAGKMYEMAVLNALRAGGISVQTQVFSKEWGRRFLDFLVSQGLAIETKLGAADWTNKTQALKDAARLAANQLEFVVWSVSRSSNSSFLEFLRQLGIIVVFHD